MIMKMRVDVEICISKIKIENLLRKAQWKKCSHNETGEYPQSEDNNDPAWFRPDGKYENGKTAHIWVCWAEHHEDAFIEYFRRLTRKEQLKIITESKAQ